MSILEANLLLEQGNIEEAESQYEEALILYRKALAIYTKMDVISGIVKVNIQIGLIHRHQGNNRGALEKLEYVLRLTEKNKLLSLRAEALTNIDDVYKAQGEYQTALDY